MSRMSYPIRTNVALLLIVGLLAVVPVSAAKPKSNDAGRVTAGETPAAPRPVISKDAAVAMVRERTGGKVVRADRRTDNGRVVYQIRVVTTDGRVREYRVDATTGEMH